jgi:hypothetical protein
MGVAGAVAVFLVLATTLFSGTGPVGRVPDPRVCVASAAPPSEDVRADPLLAAASTASAAACTAMIPSR